MSASAQHAGLGEVLGLVTGRVQIRREVFVEHRRVHRYARVLQRLTTLRHGGVCFSDIHRGVDVGGGIDQGFALLLGPVPHHRGDSGGN